LSRRGGPGRLSAAFRHRSQSSEAILSSSRNPFLRAPALAILAGISYALSFPPYGISFTVWPAVGLLVLAVGRAGSARRALGCGMLTGATACILGYHWIAQTAHDFGEVHWIVAAGALLIFAVIGELNMSLFAVALWWLRRPLARLPAAWTAALFTAIEFVTPKIFPDVLAHSQIDVPWLASASALLGQYGLGFAIAWVSIAVLRAVQERGGDAARRGRLEAGLAVLGILALCGYGGVRQLRPVPVERSLDVVMLQTNVGDPISLVNESRHDAVVESLVTLYVEWTERVLDDSPVDLIVWPETAMPTGSQSGMFYPIQRLAIETGAPVVFGGYDFERDAERRWHIYNTLYWIDPQGTLRDRYHKNMLIPIGESIPFESVWPQLRNWLPNAGEFTPGPGPQVMEIEGTLMAPLICYELIFPHYVRRALTLGGEVLLNVSNDYWFGRTAEPQQHLALARMRAYESGRPIIRCTNTGISALIDSRGHLTQRSGIWRQETLRGTIDVPVREWTPYARWGERMLLAFMGLVCAVTWGLARLPRRA